MKSDLKHRMVNKNKENVLPFLCSEILTCDAYSFYSFFFNFSPLSKKQRNSKNPFVIRQSNSESPIYPMFLSLLKDCSKKETQNKLTIAHVVVRYFFPLCGIIPLLVRPKLKQCHLMIKYC